MPRKNHSAALTRTAARAWLGAPRLDRLPDGGRWVGNLALDLYEWNARVAAAAFIDVGHFEMALRNSYDRQLSWHYPNWAIDPGFGLFRNVQGKPRSHRAQRELNERGVQELAAAARGLGGSRSHGQGARS